MLIRLLHFEYLSFDEKTSEVFIPNREIAREFYEVSKSWQLGRTDPGAGVFGQHCTVMENVASGRLFLDSLYFDIYMGVLPLCMSVSVHDV